MDPMDYAMDDAQANQQSPTSASRRFQCQPPQLSSAAPNFTPQGRDNPHYDPVHDSNGWYHGNNSPSMSRPSYAPAPNVSQWANPSFLPMQHSFHAYTELQRAASQGSEPASFRPSRAFLDMPWNEVQGFEPLRFGYPPYPHPGDPGSSPSQHPATGAGAHRPQVSHNPYGRDGQMNISPQYRAQVEATMNSNPPLQRGTDDNAFGERTARYHHGVPFPPEPRTGGQSRATRQSVASRANSAAEIPYPRRRANYTWDSDDEEGPPEAAVTFSELQRRQAEYLFSEGFGGERTLAAMRGAIATGKRVPSKEAIASLETVKLEDLTGNDRTCIICYNEFGVENPEGLVEKPLRLPKCKHLFGDKCIKKWFEDSDSCPYCRDKLPSELSIKKSMGSEAYRAARERLHFMHQTRPRNALAPRNSLPEETASERINMSNAAATSQRALEDYEYMMHRELGPWGVGQQNRSSTSDSPERRRQTRGRVGSSRAAHQLGRPTSVGSARSINPTFGHQIVSHRNSTYSTPSAPLNPHTPHRSITPGLPRQGSTGDSSSTTQTPPRNRLPSGLGSVSSSPETPSSPIVVGSGGSMRESQTDRPGRASARRSLDVSAHPYDWSSGQMMFLGQQDADFNSNRPPSHGGNSMRRQTGDEAADASQTYQSAEHSSAAETMVASPTIGSNSSPRW